MLPFARELLKTGTVVVLAANEEPCINDITAEELQEVVLEAAKLDALLSHAVLEQALRVVSSGNALCVIDLSHVRPPPGLPLLPTRVAHVLLRALCSRRSPVPSKQCCSCVTSQKHSCASTKFSAPPVHA